MRKLALTAAAVTALMAFGALPAAAWDKCHGPVSAKGSKKHDMREAMEAAKRHWHEHAEDKYGHHFANWNYSGDRTISCKWDAPGRHFWCTATARPCGRI